MQVFHGLSHQLMSETAADHIQRELKSHPAGNFAFAWGNSPRLCYQILSERAASDTLDFSRLKAYAVDEYLDYRRVGETLLRECFYDRVGITEFYNPADYPPGSESLLTLPEDEEPEYGDIDPAFVNSISSRVSYDSLIEQNGGIDFMLLGMGRNGHLAACEPGTSFESLSHYVELAQETIDDNSSKYGNGLRNAITMGLASMMRARKILLLVSGDQKRAAARNALYGPVTELCPASVLQRHPNLTVLIDFAI